MILAIFVGLSLGALGSGGSIITTPLLVYIAGIPPEDAVGMSLVIVGTTSLAGAIVHLKSGNVALKPSILFAATGMIGSFVGSYGTHLVSRKALMLIFAGTMIVAGVRMWRAGKIPKRGTFDAIRCLSIGLIVGLFTGFLGIGGGFLIVPALVLFAGLDSRLAAGTSLAVITLNSTTGIIGQLRFTTLNWNLIAGFLVFTLIGVLGGAVLANHLDDFRLRRLFACTVIILAVAVAVGNLLT